MSRVISKAELREHVVNISMSGHEGDLVDAELVLDLIDQLDEPATKANTVDNEVLDANRKLAKRVKELERQLDEPEKPVVPSFVAEWIKKCKDLNVDLFNSMTSSQMSKEVSDWLENLDGEGLDLYARAWLDGYTVEEKRYLARLNILGYEHGIAAYLRTQSSDPEERMTCLEIGSKYIAPGYTHLSEFTQKELEQVNVWHSDQWEIIEVQA